MTVWVVETKFDRDGYRTSSTSICEKEGDAERVAEELRRELEPLGYVVLVNEHAVCTSECVDRWMKVRSGRNSGASSSGCSST